MAYQSFEELEIWKSSKQLCVELYREVEQIKDYSFKDQIRRAAVSIPSNIAEGAERNSPKEFIHFLHIAKGSAAELRTQLMIASELGFIDKETERQFTNELKTISARTHSLVQHLKNSLNPKT